MKFVYTKSQYEMPDGKYLAKFLGVTMREDKPGDKPRLGQDGKPLPPAMTWDFEILEGEQAGKKADKLTGRIPTPKSGCGKMLAAIADTVLKDGVEVDLANYVGQVYRITIEDNRVSDNPPPSRVWNHTPAPAAATRPPSDEPPADPPEDLPATRPDPDAKWDYHAGTVWVRDAATADVEEHIRVGKLDAGSVWVKPAGSTDRAKRANEFHFVSGDKIPF